MQNLNYDISVNLYSSPPTFIYEYYGEVTEVTSFSFSSTFDRPDLFSASTAFLGAFDYTGPIIHLGHEFSFSLESALAPTTGFLVMQNSRVIPYIVQVPGCPQVPEVSSSILLCLGLCFVAFFRARGR